MADLTLSEFADKVGELMPVMIREFARHQVAGFYKLRITMPQFYVLDILNHNGESKMSDLAKVLGVTTANMTGIVDRLVRESFVLRASDPHDRRITKVKLTSRGARVVRDMIRKRRDIIVRMFGVISPAEREQYLNILGHIHEHFR